MIGAEPLAFQWYYQSTNALSNEANVLTLSRVQPAQAGGYSVVVSNSYGMVTSQVAVLTVYSLGDALDDASLVWRTNGNAGWFSQTNVTHDGVDAAASGLLTHNESSILDTTIIGPGTLTFWWKVSSEVGFDFLALQIGPEEE